MSFELTSVITGRIYKSKYSITSMYCTDYRHIPHIKYDSKPPQYQDDDTCPICGAIEYVTDNNEYEVFQGFELYAKRSIRNNTVDCSPFQITACRYCDGRHFRAVSGRSGRIVPVAMYWSNPLYVMTEDDII